MLPSLLHLSSPKDPPCIQPRWPTGSGPTKIIEFFNVDDGPKALHHGEGINCQPRPSVCACPSKAPLTSACHASHRCLAKHTRTIFTDRRHQCHPLSTLGPDKSYPMLQSPTRTPTRHHRRLPRYSEQNQDIPSLPPEARLPGRHLP